MSSSHGFSFSSLPDFQMPSRSRPTSQYSGSDYSQPQTPYEYPASSKMLGETSPERAMFEDVSLESHPSANDADDGTDTNGPSRSNEESILESQQSTTVSSHSRQYSEDLYYSASPIQSRRSSSNRTLAMSPVTPRDAHMSIHSLQSLVLAESDYDYSRTPPEQTMEGLAPAKESHIEHSRRPSSLDMLENVWSPAWSESQNTVPERPAPPKRQSTLFDMSKDLPLTPTTPTNEEEQKEEGLNDNEASNGGTSISEDAKLNVDKPSGSSLAVMDTSSVWMSEGGSSGRGMHTKRISSLFAPTRMSNAFEGEEIELDWTTLDRTEKQEKEDKDLASGFEDESTQFLLARLEQENAKFTADPKSSTGAPINIRQGRARTQTGTRPPSMAHLKKLVSQQDAPSIRFSLVSSTEEEASEEPPPMTELEFWTALVQDYPFTAYRLPTLTTTKIRAGIPPPLRGVVWTSLSGARDKILEDAFDTLQNEESPYEGIINKDIGRSFPGVEMFRDADGEGQKMLGRVLKCFSLHDKDIGYCQGLGFLVGPLLMNMGEKEAFCVLVRLMEHYALRPSFLPSLSGLHLRIFQFSVLLNQNYPELADHLGALGIEPAYLSQWFLSCFAVTCPLQMLFRIYDVIFAEGANETVMRVALSLFRRNEEIMMEMTEFEEVMQLLLGRTMWDVYASNGDDLVDDFTALGNIVTHARLTELEREFESKGSEAIGQSAGFLPDVQAAASRFLGRLWTPNNATPIKGGAGGAATLAPQSAEKDGSTAGYLTGPRGFLRRTSSKQSLGTVNDSTPGDSSASSGSASSTSTAPTEFETHDSTGTDHTSMKSKAESITTVSGSVSAHAQHMSTTSGSKEQELQSEIEDLLMALSELQREHAQMAASLQKEREERSDDHRAVGQLLNKLTNGETQRKTTHRRSMPPAPGPLHADLQGTKVSDKRKTLPPRPRLHIVTETQISKKDIVVDAEHKEAIAGLVNEVQSRLDSNARLSASFETRAQLRGALARTREQLAAAEAQVKALNERAESSEASLSAFQEENESLRAESEELRGRVNDDFKVKQKLELTIENLRIQMRMEAKALEKKQRNASLARTNSSGEVPTVIKSDSPARSRTGSVSSNPGNPGGLRDLKLGKRDSAGSVASNRSVKSLRQADDEWPIIPPPPPAAEILNSPPRSPTIDITPTAPLQPALPQQTSLTVPPPSGPSFGRRTTSLATQEVFATQQHEPVPDEALLLELVNAKTAEATARQEIDELKKSMQMQKRRADENFLELQNAVATARMETLQAREEAEEAREEANAARAEVFDASLMSTPITPGGSTPGVRGDRFPVTPGTNVERTKRPTPPSTASYSPDQYAEPKEAEPAASSLGGWFWNKRTTSAAKAPMARSVSGDK